MASYQRIALYILFDAIEADLTSLIRSAALPEGSQLLSSDERAKALLRLQNQTELETLRHPDGDLINGLDIGDKLAVLNRCKKNLPQIAQTSISQVNDHLSRSISVRNSVMHGRPLTTNDYSTAFSLAESLFRAPSVWPTLASTYRDFTVNPEKILSASFELIESRELSETLNNLPTPDYDDTGFVPRPTLEKDLKKKLLGRHPVITVLGDGGNGKSPFRKG